VLVAGGGRGIGRAAALACAEAGADVVVAARTQDQVAATALAVQQIGRQALPLTGDVADYGAATRLVERTLDRFGRLDVLVNCAGILQPVAPVWQADPARWSYNLSVNLIGAFHLTQVALQPMMTIRRGRIIHVSSGAAQSVVAGWSAYCAAKAGLDHFVRVVASEVTEYGIAVYSFYPGIVETAMQAELRGVLAEDFGEANLARFRAYHEQGWLRPPEEPAQVILYLAALADEARSGEVFSIDDPAVRYEVSRALGSPMLKGRGE
jgi:NAD(P)-dependent dehydrogenase (short-subunit alcohol dehydrogenase family)